VSRASRRLLEGLVEPSQALQIVRALALTHQPIARRLASGTSRGTIAWRARNGPSTKSEKETGVSNDSLALALAMVVILILVIRMRDQ
jgi:hypothetical protein